MLRTINESALKVEISQGMKSIEPFALEGPCTFTNASLCDLHFSQSRLGFLLIRGRWLQRSSIKNCVFSHVGIDPLKLFNTDLNKSIFRSCSIGKNYLSGFFGCCFNDCVFEQCAIGRLSFTKTTLSMASFQNNSSNAQFVFKKCKLTNCSFTGHIEQVFLKDCILRNVDFTDTVLPSFTRVPMIMDGLSLPNRPDNFAFCFDKLPLVLERASKQITRDSFVRLEKSLNSYAPNDVTCIHREPFLVLMSDREASIVMKILYEHRLEQQSKPPN